MPGVRMRVRRSVLWLAGLCLAWLLAGCTNTDEPPTAPSTEPGKIEFESYCAACHQPEGQGTEGGAPPLAGSPWVAGPGTRLIRIVLHGLRGPIEVGEETYNLEMPGFGPVLTDAEIASTLSFVRRHHGAPSPPIAPATVARIRAITPDRIDYWTVEELLEDP